MDAFDSELRGRLARLLSAAPGHLGTLPTAPVRTAGRRVGWRQPVRRPAALVTGLVGAVLVAIIVGATWLLILRPVPTGRLLPGAGDGGDRIVWDSGLVRLEADAVRIETPNGTFRAIDVTPIPDPESGTAPAGWSPSPEEPWDQRPGIESVDFLVRSDPGDTERTLEVTWKEAGVEMRLQLYLAADDAEWWVREVRVYDGSKDGEWIGWGGTFGWTSEDVRRANRLERVCMDVEVPTKRCPEQSYTPEALQDMIVDLGLFRTPLGATWSGDLDLVDGSAEPGGGEGTGELHISGMRLSAY